MVETKYKKSGIFGFYRRKAIFFAIVLAAGFLGWRGLTGNLFLADRNATLTSTISQEAAILVTVDHSGQIFINGKRSGKRVSALSDYDEVRLPVVDESGQYYDRVVITLKLPAAVAYETEHELLVIHGVDNSRSYTSDGSTIVYEANGVSGYATLSIVAKLPKGYIDFPLTEKAKQVLLRIQANVWVGIAIALPLLTLIFMLLFILRQRRSGRIDLPGEEITAPPMLIPPAIVGVLMNQHVRAREVAATLVDLAVRGDIVILDRDRDFAFGKGRFDQRLLGYEKILLTKIFRESLSSDRLEIEKRINNHFYSKKISLVSAGVYAVATRLGYFKVNPQRLFAQYRLIGILAFLVGAGGFALSLLYMAQPPYIIFFWAGMMISALVVAFSASSIPIRTPLGRETMSNWLAFKRYLSSAEPIPYSENLPRIFEKYLPYAIVMDCEAAWARRFIEHNFTLPGWFLTDKSGLGLDDFCLSLFPIISYVSRSLVALREPGFE
ncbi:MAG: DUF2207 domain-containing protein [Patescibacteria group bacterium]